MPRRPWQAFLLVVLLLVLVALPNWRPELLQQAAPRPIEAGVYHVARVVDGDTLVLTEQHERVRLIGADTPETVKPDHPVEPWGPKATEFTKAFLSGSEVRLEFNGESRDKYGRILAYVWVGDRMLNEELLRAGLARAKVQYHYSPAKKARFRRAEAEAQAAHRGIWSAEHGGQSSGFRVQGSGMRAER
jgi:micrococcal nuclease